MAVTLSKMTQRIREEIRDNLPTEMPISAVRFPNMPFDQPANRTWMDVRINFDKRERVVVGVKEYRYNIEVILALHTPNDIGMLDHETIIDDLMLVFDDKNLSFDDGTIRFDESEPETFNSVSNFFITEITCPCTVWESREPVVQVTGPT